MAPAGKFSAKCEEHTRLQMPRNKTQPASRPEPGQAGPAKDEPMFDPGAVIRRVTGEAFPLLSGGRALLLQLAHPLIAAGVAEHGSFQEDPLGRLIGTLRFVDTVVFGTRAEAERAAEWLERLHTSVRGRTTEPTEHFPPGTRYSAVDPVLARWVFATLIETGLVSYLRFVAPLSEAERLRYYEEAREFARLLKVPEALIPATLGDLNDYMDWMIASGRIAVTDQARRLADEVLHPNLGGLPALTVPPFRFVTAGTLPEPLRTDYGLDWNPEKQLLLDGVSRVMRTLRPWMPRWIWQSPLRGPGLARWLLGGLIEDSAQADPASAEESK